MAVLDDILEHLKLEFEQAFAGRIRGCYLYGSYANGTAIETSDIDLTILFKADFLSDDERVAARAFAENYRAPIALDIEITDEASLFANADPTFKLGSRLVFGEDIRDQLPLMSMSVWTRDRMHTSYWRLMKLFDRALPVKAPLEYPNPEDEFYGYVRKELAGEGGADGVLVTRDLLRSVSWMATALVALQAGEYVVNKSEFVKAYQRYVGDGWGVWLQALYTRCKLEWRYLVPPNQTDLRELCGQVLAFENHFFTRYRAFFMAELEGNDLAGVRQALWVWERLPWDDTQMIEVVERAKLRTSTGAVSG